MTEPYFVPDSICLRITLGGDVVECYWDECLGRGVGGGWGVGGL